MKKVWDTRYEKGMVQDVILRNGRMYKLWTQGRFKYIKIGQTFKKI